MTNLNEKKTMITDENKANKVLKNILYKHNLAIFIKTRYEINTDKLWAHHCLQI